MSAEPTMLEQLLAAIEQAKEERRRCHEATTDLRHAIKDAREMGRALQRDELEPWLRTQLAELQTQLGDDAKAAMDVNRGRIIRKFDELFNLLMTGTESGHGSSLEPRIRRVAQERQQRRENGQ